MSEAGIGSFPPIPTGTTALSPWDPPPAGASVTYSGVEPRPACDTQERGSQPLVSATRLAQADRQASRLRGPAAPPHLLAKPLTHTRFSSSTTSSCSRGPHRGGPWWVPSSEGLSVCNQIGQPGQSRGQRGVWGRREVASSWPSRGRMRPTRRAPL